MNMNFELGKSYIVAVTEKGITPLMEFDRNQWFDKDHDDLDFLTDEEKAVIINDMLDKIKGYIDHISNTGMGKKKSLEFIEKFVKGLKAEIQ